ncbi:MAG: hypothetical protein AAF902_16565 [Chloroflexota bacterium]
MTTRKALTWFIILLGIGTLSVAQAHSLGQETLSKHSLFTITDTTLTLEYTLDMAERPTFEELRRMDTNNDEITSQEEADQYVLDTAERLISKIDLSVNGQPVMLEMTSHEFDVSLSGHELPVLYLQYQFEAEIAPADAWSFEYDDANFPSSIGWREVVVQAGNGLEMVESTVSSKDLSEQLSDLPTNMKLNPIQDSGTWVVSADAGPETPTSNPMLMIALAFGAAIAVFAGFIRLILR